MENVIAIYPYDHAQLDFVFDDWGNEIENACAINRKKVIKHLFNPLLCCDKKGEKHRSLN